MLAVIAAVQKAAMRGFTAGMAHLSAVVNECWVESVVPKLPVDPARLPETIVVLRIDNDDEWDPWEEHCLPADSGG